MNAALTAPESASPVAANRPISASETQLSRLRSAPLWRMREILWIAAACGLVAGTVESLYWCIKRFVLHEFTYVHDDVFWMSPMAHLGLFLILALPLAWLVHRIPHPATGMISILLLAMAGAQCVCLLFPQIHPLAQLLVSIGIATQFLRWCQKHPVHARQRACRIAVLLATLTALAGATQVGARIYSERRNLAALPPAAADSPNVLLLVLDTVRADAIGAYGANADRTPSLNRLAESGVLFEEAVSPSSWTLPATASLMTGRLPGELSADWLSPLDSRHRTLAESLRDQGYATAGFVANYKYATAETGLARGFLHYDSHSHSLVEFAACTAVGRALFFSRTLPNLGCYTDPVRRTAGEINSRLLAWTQNQQRPWFAFVNYLDVHDPYAAPRSFSQHAPADAQERLLLRFWWFLQRDTLTTSEADLARNAYADCLQYLDSEIGRLIDALEARGELHNSLIIVTSDHGEHFGEQGLYLHGNSLYQPLVHVPLLIVARGRVPGGLRVPQPVSTADVPATVLDLIGGSARRFPGRSLAPFWSDEQPPLPPRPVVSELLSPPICPPCQGASPIFRGSMKSVRLGELKYIWNADGSEELFDLATDPGEQQNLAGHPDWQSELDRVRAVLAITTGRNDGALATAAD